METKAALWWKIWWDEFDNAFNLLGKIREGKIKIADAKDDQIKFKPELGETKKNKQKNRSNKQKSTLYNIKILYKARKILLN